MASKNPLSLLENNDERVTVVATTNDPADGTPLNLTGLTVEVYLKVSAATDDGDAGTWKGSTATSGVTVTDAANGEFSVTFPHAKVTTAMGWWRADAVDGAGLRKTIAYGAVTVEDT